MDAYNLSYYLVRGAFRVNALFVFVTFADRMRNGRFLVMRLRSLEGDLVNEPHL